jgi:hypothetical protein
MNQHALHQVLLDCLLIDANGRCVLRDGVTRESLAERIQNLPNGILQPWVADLGLRHQGCLLASVRGCDTAPKEDASKAIQRVFRGAILIPHCGDATKAKSFIQVVPDDQLIDLMTAFAKNHDNYPHHYVMHIVHAAEIIGYKQPKAQGLFWRDFYHRMCKALHVTPETEAEMDGRLSPDEETFFKAQHV